jgi:DNA invertase Pin-like site-specific DNA recombinase
VINKDQLANLTTPEKVLSFLNSFWKDLHFDLPGDNRRAIIYVRKSRLLANQPHYSDVVQEKKCKEYAQNQGWRVVEVIIDLDESGKNSKRPGFQRLLGLVKTGKANVVLVHHLDRSYRNGFSFPQFIAYLQDYGVDLVSLSEQLDSRTFVGRLIMMILAVTAEWPIWAASERSRAAQNERFERGYHNGGYRLGYCNGLCSNCTDPNGEDHCPLFGGPDRADSQNGRIQVPHPIEKYAVRFIVHAYNTGQSDREIANFLNQHFFELPDGSIVKFRTKGVPGLYPPGEFKRDTIREIVRNPFHVGYVAHYHTAPLSMKDNLENPKEIKNTVQNRRQPEKLQRGLHEPLYPYEIWEANLRLRHAKGTTPTTGEKSVSGYLLKGVGRCFECYAWDRRRASLRGSNNGSGKATYRCATVHERHKALQVGQEVGGILQNTSLQIHPDDGFVELIEQHTHTSLPAPKLEAQIDRLIENFSIPTEWYDHILGYFYSNDGLSEFQRKSYNLHAEMKNLIDLRRKGLIDQAQFDGEFDHLSGEIQKLKPSQQPGAPEIIQLLTNFRALWQKLTITERNALLKIMFDGLYFDSNCVLRKVSARGPFDQLLNLP